MPKLQKRKIKSKDGKISEGFFLTIPKDMVGFMKWKPGDTIRVIPEGPHILKLFKYGDEDE